MEIVVGAKTDVGRRRAHNEDYLCVDERLGLFVVCDGLGGRNAGEIASRLAVDVIRDYLRETQGKDPVAVFGGANPRFSDQTNRLAGAIHLANKSIHQAAATDAAWEGMGTTVVAVLLSDAVLSMGHVGDSRIYLIRDQKIQQLTRDHSLVEELVRGGFLTEEQAARHPHRHIVTRALGIEDGVEVDLDELPLAHGDRLLLCSDGLTAHLKPADMLAAIQAEADPEAAAGRLVTLANAAGGEDNITVILLAVPERRSDAGPVAGGAFH